MFQILTDVTIWSERFDRARIGCFSPDKRLSGPISCFCVFDISLSYNCFVTAISSYLLYILARHSKSKSEPGVFVACTCSIKSCSPPVIVELGSIFRGRVDSTTNKVLSCRGVMAIELPQRESFGVSLCTVVSTCEAVHNFHFNLKTN